MGAHHEFDVTEADVAMFNDAVRRKWVKAYAPPQEKGSSDNATTGIQWRRVGLFLLIGTVASSMLVSSIPALLLPVLGDDLLPLHWILAAVIGLPIGYGVPGTALFAGSTFGNFCLGFALMAITIVALALFNSTVEAKLLDLISAATNNAVALSAGGAQ